MPGQKLVWVSPLGQKVARLNLARHKPCPNSSSNAQPNHDQVALTVPETAKPGQTLEFQVPASIVSGGRSHDPDPNICLTPTLTGPWELLRILTLSAYSHPSLGKSPSPKVTHLPRFASSSTQPPPAEDVPASAPAPVVPSADRDGGQATLEIVIPADWKDGVKLATTLESGQRVIITPPTGSKPGTPREFNLT